MVKSGPVLLFPHMSLPFNCYKVILLSLLLALSVSKAKCIISHFFVTLGEKIKRQGPLCAILVHDFIGFDFMGEPALGFTNKLFILNDFVSRQRM